MAEPERDTVGVTDEIAPMRDYGLPPLVLVTTPAELTALMESLADVPAVAVDTESNSLFAYRERVCLIQFSTPATDYLVDPLQIADLSRLAPFFADRRRQKIFHAAEYDILCLKRDYHFEFANLFDTMLAARALGWLQLGLGAILAERFGIRLDKRYQRADWGRRPLSDAQLDYARLDTHYLIDLRNILQAELEAAGRLAEMQEEFERLAHLTPDEHCGKDEARSFWRINGARGLSPRQAGILQALYLERDRQARRADRPPFKVLGDAVLVEIARRCPQSAAELHGIVGLPPAKICRHVGWILRAVEQGLAAPLPAVPPVAPAREVEEVCARYRRLRQWRRQKALERGVESDVILPRQALWEIARRAPRTLEALETIAQLGSWRRQTYGAEILSIILTEAEKQGDSIE